MRNDDELRALIQKKADALGWSGAELARKADVSQQNVQRILSGEVRFSRSIPAILTALGIKPSLAGDLSPAGKVRALPADNDLIFGEELVGERDFPVFAGAAGGSGHMIISTDPIQYVRRPDRLLGVPKGYGLIVVGDSMKPAFWHGDIALVHPHLSIRSSVDVVIYRNNDGDQHEAVIKHLVRETPTEWMLRQWNPPEGESEYFSLGKEDWSVCHYVVGRYAGR